VCNLNARKTRCSFHLRSVWGGEDRDLPQNPVASQADYQERRGRRLGEDNFENSLCDVEIDLKMCDQVEVPSNSNFGEITKNEPDIRERTENDLFNKEN